MSKRKERQVINLADYKANRAPVARWMNGHRTRCTECGKGGACQLVTVARARGMRLP